MWFHRSEFTKLMFWTQWNARLVARACVFRSATVTCIWMEVYGARSAVLKASDRWVFIKAGVAAVQDPTCLPKLTSDSQLYSWEPSALHIFVAYQMGHITLWRALWSKTNHGRNTDVLFNTEVLKSGHFRPWSGNLFDVKHCVQFERAHPYALMALATALNIHFRPTSSTP